MSSVSSFISPELQFGRPETARARTAWSVTSPSDLDTLCLDGHAEYSYGGPRSKAPGETPGLGSGLGRGNGGEAGDHTVPGLSL